MRTVGWMCLGPAALLLGCGGGGATLDGGLDAGLDGAKIPDAMGRDGKTRDARSAQDAGREASTTDGGGLDATVDAGPPTDPTEGVGGVELVQAGFEFVEGPQWRPAQGDLLFSDIPASVIYRFVPGDGITTFRDPSEHANGLALDAEGRLLAAEHGSRSVTRTPEGGERETLAATFEGSRLNSPNDIAVRSDGTLYFTDPPYGIDAGERELDFNGVFRLDPDGELHAEWRGGEDTRPNGIALSPDERTLYVARTDDGGLYAWDVSEDGALSELRELARTAGGADGMAVDVEGNLYVTSSDGVEVFAPDGSRWGVIEVPDGRRPANCGFGGDGMRTLYITANSSGGALYQVRVPIAGRAP